MTLPSAASASHFCVFGCGPSFSGGGSTIITGGDQQGNTVTCNRATAHGVPNRGYDYTFLRNGSPIPGHTNQSSSSYTLTSSDVGSFISCRVRASNIFGNVTSTSTNSIGPVRPPAPSNTGAPFISGTARQGETLTCNPGSWSNSPTSYQYRFLRNGVAVGSSQSYTVQAADVGQSVRCGVRASNAGGTSSEALSAPVTPVPLAPTSTSPPSISGTAQPGGTLTCNPGSWSNSPTSFAYEFLRNGAVAGSSQTYTVASSDVGQQIKCRVTATNAGGSGTAKSAAVTPTNPSTGGGGGNPGGGGGNTTTNTTVVNNTILRARAIRRCKKRLKGKRGAARRRALKRYRKCVRRARKRFPAR